MKTIGTLFLLLSTTVLCSAEAIRTHVGAQVRLSLQDVTAAYSIDPECADVEVTNGLLIVTGKHICTTHIILVRNGDVGDLQAVVLPRRNGRPGLSIGPTDVQQSGSIGTYYSSNPGEVQTTLDMFRAVGDKSTSVSLALARGRAFSPTEIVTSVPSASISFTDGTRSVGLLDSLVDHSPLILDNVVVRGFHYQSPTWFLHAGLASSTNFQRRWYEDDDDRTVAVGRSFALGDHSSLTPGAQWISGSSRYLAAESGAIGSLQYRYDNPNRLRFAGEIGTSGSGLAASSSFDFAGSSDVISAKARVTPDNFPGLSTSPPRGVQADGSWNHRFGGRFATEIVGARDSYALVDRTSLTNSTWGGRLEFRPARRWMLSAGSSGASLDRALRSPIRSLSAPTSLGFESLHFGNLFQYQYRTNSTSELGSHSFRDSVRLTLHPVTLTVFASRQTQAPTVSYIVENLPFLRDAMLAEGFFASTPEEIENFIRSHSALLATGQLRNLQIDIAPVRDQIGATLSWTVLRNRLSTRLEWRSDNDYGLRGNSKSMWEEARLSLRLTPETEFQVSASLFTNRVVRIDSVRRPYLSVGIRRQFGKVPAFLVPSTLGAIHGRVYNDEQSSLPESVPGTHAGLAGVIVVLDGVRRTTTNRNGDYRFGAVIEGRHSVEVLYPASESEVFTTPPYVTTTENTEVNFGIGERQAAIFGYVHNDVSVPLAGVVVRIAGQVQRETRSDNAGAFAFTAVPPGTYSVTLDQETLPPSYAMPTVLAETVVARLDEPGRAEFTARALRSISGRVICSASEWNTGDVRVEIEGVDGLISLSNNGEFIVRDLSSGTIELVATYKSASIRRLVEVPSGAADVVAPAIDLCKAPGDK